MAERQRNFTITMYSEHFLYTLYITISKISNIFSIYIIKKVFEHCH